MLSNNTNRAHQWILAGCATMALFSTGCRSGMRGMNMFGMRSEPSAETLAGSGPSTTYPAPPSASATPEAIASIAGGTVIPVSAGVPESPPFGGSQVASSNTIPGYASPQATNMAAANANGFANGSLGATQPVGYASPTATKPSGYSYGSKAFTPKPVTAASTAGSTPTYAGGSSYTKSSAYTPPATSYAIPANSSAPASSSAPVASTTPSSSSGFTLPAGMSPTAPAGMSPTAPAGMSPAVAAATELPSSPAVASTPSETSGDAGYAIPPGSFAPPAAVAPSFSTASAAATTAAPSSSLTPPQPSSTPSGYSPGSTASGTSYPAGGYLPPTTNGSFYR